MISSIEGTTFLHVDSTAIVELPARSCSRCLALASSRRARARSCRSRRRAAHQIEQSSSVLSSALAHFFDFRRAPCDGEPRDPGTMYSHRARKHFRNFEPSTLLTAMRELGEAAGISVLPHRWSRYQDVFGATSLGQLVESSAHSITQRIATARLPSPCRLTSVSSATISRGVRESWRNVRSGGWYIAKLQFFDGPIAVV